jgi:hypothetical protein
MTREGIAEYFNVSIATVRRWIKEMDVPRPTRRTRPKRPKHLTTSGGIIAKPGDGYNSLERAKMILGGRLIEKPGYGYYLDGRPAHIDDILKAAR